MQLSELQPAKALSTMVVTLLGIFMLVRVLHSLKALSPIFLTLLGIFMLVRALQPSNVLLVDYQYYTL